jgi:hypothetical protein
MHTYASALKLSFVSSEAKSAAKSKFDNYANLDLHSKLAFVIKLPNDGNWEILDQIPEVGLYLLHHTKDADPRIYGRIRGIIIDINAGLIVCKGRSYTPICTSNLINPDVDGTLELTDDENKSVYKLKKYSIKRGYEATSIYRWKHKGVVYYSTNKTINAADNKWGESNTFKELYSQMQGPLDEDLFHPETVYSPYVHEFLLVHPELLHVSKMNVGIGFITYIGTKVMWDINKVNLSEIDIIRDGLAKSITGVAAVPLNVTTPVIHISDDISVDVANDLLNNGWYPERDYSKTDPRLIPGEFVVVYGYNANNEIEHVIKVQSTSYAWRSSLRNQKSDLYRGFCELVSDSYDSKTFDDKYPILETQNTESKDSDHTKTITTITPATPVALNTNAERLHNIFLCYISCLPIHKQSAAADFEKRLLTERNDLIKWIQSLYTDTSGISYRGVFHKRLHNILTQAIKQAGYASLNPRTPEIASMTKKQIYDDNVSSFIYNERGYSLYFLIKLMNSQ